jgi:CitB family two-component system response regulator CitT
VINVIIAEDDYRVASVHEKFVEKVSGMHVVGKALNGEQTIELVKQKQADLLLLDIYLPDKLGTELVQEIRSIQSAVDIIMISAATEKAVVADAIHHGIFDYIIKPVKMERFIETMEKYKKMKEKMEAAEDIDQLFLDDYFGRNHAEKQIVKQTPKGIDPLTLERIKEIILREKKGIAAEEMGAKIGASRTTARRYLEYLTSTGEITAELEYGIVGRPERKYHVIV